MSQYIKVGGRWLPAAPQVQIGGKAVPVKKRFDRRGGKWVEECVLPVHDFTSSYTHTGDNIWYGTHTGYCSCGKQSTPEEHDWIDHGTIDEPTCDEYGYGEYICDKCRAWYEYTISPTGHNWEWEGSTEADCMDPAFTWYECTICGETKEETNGILGDHKWGEQITSQEPTCTEDGWAYQECSVCGEWNDIRLESLGHDTEYIYSEADCTTGGFDGWVCKKCETVETGGETPPLGHNFVHGACSRCGMPENLSGGDNI